MYSPLALYIPIDSYDRNEMKTHTVKDTHKRQNNTLIMQNRTKTNRRERKKHVNIERSSSEQQGDIRFIPLQRYKKSKKEHKK